MKISYHTWHSSQLNQKVELKVYGTNGRPLLVFPTSQGRFYDYENFGMIDAVQQHIVDERLIVFTIDSIDSQSWFNPNLQPSEKAQHQNDYDQFVYKEVIPFIKYYESSAPRNNIIVTGCSFGAYHAANFFFKHPDVVNGLVALSGIYSVDFSVGDYVDDNVYFNDPLRYLPNLKDPWYIDRFNDSDIIICSGQGAHEEPEKSRALSTVLDNIHVNHWLDLWGLDVYHDWYWWKKQITYFLGHLKKRPLID